MHRLPHLVTWKSSIAAPVPGGIGRRWSGWEVVEPSLFVVVPVILIGFIHHFVRVAKAVFPKVLNFS